MHWNQAHSSWIIYRIILKWATSSLGLNAARSGDGFCGAVFLFIALLFSIAWRVNINVGDVVHGRCCIAARRDVLQRPSACLHSACNKVAIWSDNQIHIHCRTFNKLWVLYESRLPFLLTSIWKIVLMWRPNDGIENGTANFSLEHIYGYRWCVKRESIIQTIFKIEFNYRTTSTRRPGEHKAPGNENIFEIGDETAAVCYHIYF